MKLYHTVTIYDPPSCRVYQSQYLLVNYLISYLNQLKSLTTSLHRKIISSPIFYFSSSLSFPSSSTL